MSSRNKSESRLAAELRKLDQEISKVIRVVLATIAGVLLVYIIRFWLVLRYPLSESAAAWGAFGDYFGGLLNPLIAFTALYWLTRSVRLQKEELNETRAALEDSATAQRDQVEVASWTALINSNTARMQHLQYLLSQVKQRVAELQPKPGEIFNGSGYQDRFKQIQAVRDEAIPIENEISDRANQSSIYEEKLRKLADRAKDDA